MITHGGAVSRIGRSLVLLQHPVPSNIPLLGGRHGDRISGFRLSQKVYPCADGRVQGRRLIQMIQLWINSVKRWIQQSSWRNRKTICGVRGKPWEQGGARKVQRREDPSANETATYIAGKELGTGKWTLATGVRDLRTGAGPKGSCTAMPICRPLSRLAERDK